MSLLLNLLWIYEIHKPVRIFMVGVIPPTPHTWAHWMQHPLHVHNFMALLSSTSDFSSQNGHSFRKGGRISLMRYTKGCLPKGSNSASQNLSSLRDIIISLLSSISSSPCFLLNGTCAPPHLFWFLSFCVTFSLMQVPSFRCVKGHYASMEI